MRGARGREKGGRRIEGGASRLELFLRCSQCLGLREAPRHCGPLEKEPLTPASPRREASCVLGGHAGAAEISVIDLKLRGMHFKLPISRFLKELTGAVWFSGVVQPSKMIRNWKNTRPARGHRPGVAVARRSPPPLQASLPRRATRPGRIADGARAGRGAQVAGASRAGRGPGRVAGGPGAPPGSRGARPFSASVGRAHPCSVRLRPAQSSSDQPWADRAFGASGPRVTEQVRRLPDARGGRAPRPPAPPLSPSGGFSLLGVVDCKGGSVAR